MRAFRNCSNFFDANRAIAPSLVFEFTQSAVRAMGPIEHESLAALAERGFRFSMDNLTDLRIEPRELTERGFRFIKAPAALLLNRAGSRTDRYPSGRFLRPARPLRHRSDRRAHRERSRPWSICWITMSASGRAFCFRRRARCVRRRCKAPPATPARPGPAPRRQPRLRRAAAPAAARRPCTNSPAPAAATEAAETALPEHHRTICTAGARLRRAAVRRLGRGAQRRRRFRAGLRGADALSRRRRHRDPHHQRAAAGRLGAAHSRPARRAARRLRRDHEFRRRHPRHRREPAQRTRVPSRAATRPADLHRARCHLRAASKTADYVVCSGLFDDATRDAGRAIASCWRRCARGRCSWSAPIPTLSSSAATS